MTINGNASTASGPAWVCEAKSVKSTHALARRLAGALRPGAVLALVGQMGAGKTSFVQGLAAALGVTDLSQVLSPTYTLVNEYPAVPTSLVHIDFYRLSDVDSAHALGLDEQIGASGTITAVEWADHLPGLIPASAVWLHFEFQGRKGRIIRVRGLPEP